ncbi:uncharacterized protein LOC117112617 [Anneissia japonica]|uniref:uncharacterized protein LOC117112617 n=1 Tax=Anneissia japonica TaxID=1529436 RepID=UPI001425748C|nr:uncharacterized protein LOC117112617 [Anneissia japonica]
MSRKMFARRQSVPVNSIGQELSEEEEDTFKMFEEKLKKPWHNNDWLYKRRLSSPAAPQPLIAKRLTPKDDRKQKSLDSLVSSDKKLLGEHGMRVRDLIADVIFQHKMPHFRVKLAASRAVVNEDADAVLLFDKEIVIEVPKDEDFGTGDDKVLYCLKALAYTEESYLALLRSIQTTYANPLKNEVLLTEEENDTLFGKLEPILTASSSLLKKLNEITSDWKKDETKLGCLFGDDFWNVYLDYYANYKKLKSLLHQKTAMSREFVSFCKSQRGATRHSLESLLLLPVSGTI